MLQLEIPYSCNESINCDDIDNSSKILECTPTRMDSRRDDLRVSQTSFNLDSLEILAWEDLRRVCLLGRGTYADVYHMIETSSRKQFAVKYLNEKRWEDKPSKEYEMAAADLIMEATILSHLNHRNILKLRGISLTDTSSAATSFSKEREEPVRPPGSYRLDESTRSSTSSSAGGFGGFFLAFDILHETLKDRLDKWREFANGPPPVRGGLRRQLSQNAGNSISSMKGALARTKKTIRRSQSAETEMSISNHSQQKKSTRVEIRREGSLRKLLRRPSMGKQSEGTTRSGERQRQNNFEAFMRRRVPSGSETDSTAEVKAETEQAAPERSELRRRGSFRKLLLRPSMDQKANPPSTTRAGGVRRQKSKTEDSPSERDKEPSVSSRGLRRNNSSQTTKPTKHKYLPKQKSKPVSSRKMNLRIESVALGVASAINYLHENHILFRDLKPTNIGFDETGNVQLFDFGFARHIDDCSKYEVAGTPRYLAPEILRGEGYSFGSDAYSFGLVLYEICSLKVPAAPSKAWHDNAGSTGICDSPRWPVTSEQDGGSALLLEEEQNYYRIPSLDLIPCNITKGLIQDCLQAQAQDRPSFATVLKTLNTILSERHDDE